MVYTRTTPDNTAVASLVAGGSCRVRSHGEAPLKITAGSYLIRIAVGERTDSASALLTIYDSGDVDNAVGVRLLTGSAGITDDGQDITATALDAWSSDGNQEYAFEVALPEPTGEWVLSLRTDESSAAVPMDFSGFHVEDTLQRGTAQVGPGDIAVNALGRCRYAAFSGLGASATGAFASVTWAPTGTPDFTMRVVAASTLAPSAAACRIIGRGNTSYANLAINTNGTIQLRNNASTIAESPNGTFRFDGLAHDVRAEVTNTSVVLYYDGVVVASVTVAPQNWLTSAVSYTIGAHATSSAQRWPGSIQLVELLDNVTPANSIRLLMDEPSGNYANTYPGSTAAASATRNGYVSTVPVLSLDGRGMPWQGAPVPLVYSVRSSSTTTGITGVTGWTFAGGTTEIDPTGSIANGVWTAPCAGIAIANINASIQPTTLAGLDVVQVQLQSSVSGYASSKIQLTTVNHIYTACTRLHLNVAATETITASWASLVSGDVYTVLDGWSFVVEFYPTPVTG